MHSAPSASHNDEGDLTRYNPSEFTHAIHSKMVRVPMLRLTALLLFLPGFALAAAPTDRPNIVVFITDDESWLERSAYGWSNLPTPAFDRVARDGVLMTHGYSSAPSCAPARASLLTGRHFWQLEEGAIIQAWLPKEYPVFPQQLAQAGYQIGQTGKTWGPGIFPEQGHTAEAAGPAIRKHAVTPARPGMSRIDYAANFDDFLKQRDNKQPFCFWAGVIEPHGPWDQGNVQRLEDEFGISLEEVPLPEFAPDTQAMRELRARMVYEICYADLQLQKILDTLEATGELDNTLLVVTSDNGSDVPNGDVLTHGKATAYEWGTHVPLAFLWPGKIPQGREVTDFVSFADIGPTLLDAAGVEIPDSMTGRSFLTSLKSDESGRIDPSRDHVITGLEWHGEFDPESRAFRSLRTDDFALILHYNNSQSEQTYDGTGQPIPPAKVELFDMNRDPWQLKDLANETTYLPTKHKLLHQLQESGRESGDPRFTGEMQTFRKMREFVQARKAAGYPKGEAAMKLLD